MAGFSISSSAQGISGSEASTPPRNPPIQCGLKKPRHQSKHEATRSSRKEAWIWKARARPAAWRKESQKRGRSRWRRQVQRWTAPKRKR
jgi:hypothetical protein